LIVASAALLIILIEPDAERLSHTAISKAGLAVSSFVP
jgi:hypothetical protein